MSFLSGLPSSGNFLKFSNASHQYVPKYVSDHDTDPPEGQNIKTDDTNILIRSLSKKKKIQPPPTTSQDKSTDGLRNSSDRDTKGKRPAEELSSTSTSTTTTTSTTAPSSIGLKRQKTQESKPSDAEPLENMNKIQLVSLCKTYSLSASGSKEALVTRLKEAGVKR